MRNLAGQQFGRLLVLIDDGKTSYGERTYLCLCECGNLKESVPERDLARGDC
jgi:hypothetical protein